MNGPVVIKLGGAAIDEAASLEHLWRDIASLAADPNGRGVVVVHGGGSAVDRLFDRLGLEVQRRDGLRITPDDQVGLVVAAIAGEVNARLCARLRAVGAEAMGLTLSSAGFACEPKSRTELGCVGVVRGRVGDRVESLLEQGVVPVIACVGDDGRAGLLNVNGDDAAGGVAFFCAAHRLILLSDVDGVRGPDGSILREIKDELEVLQLIDSGTVHSGMIPKLKAAAALSVDAHIPVVIAPWKRPGVVLEVAQGRPAGTLIGRSEAELFWSEETS
ncbi:MAG: acetylglutamate kinase [Planctomycetota bacterium]